MHFKKSQVRISNYMWIYKKLISCAFFAVQIINVSHDRNILNVNTSAKILQFEISFTDK